MSKKYVNTLVQKYQLKPSHKPDQCKYLMNDTLEWTDFIPGGNSNNMIKIADLSPEQGNFHDHNHKVIYTTMIINFQGVYKYKMGIQCSRLAKNVDYTLCIETLITDYQLWHKSKISIDRSTSQGLTIGDVFVQKFSHIYLNSSNSVEFMYYHRVIVNFRNTAADPLHQLHLLVNIPQDGNDLQTYAQNFIENYIIAYGILGSAIDLDSDKIYDFHTTYEIEPTKMKMNVPLDMYGERILPPLP